MNYYINTNKQPSSQGGNYEVHKETCYYYVHYKQGNNFKYLGVFDSPIEAVKYAKKVYSTDSRYIDGCAYCCPTAHRV